jgi:hypothetical protein
MTGWGMVVVLRSPTLTSYTHTPLQGLPRFLQIGLASSWVDSVGLIPCSYTSCPHCWNFMVKSTKSHKIGPRSLNQSTPNTKSQPPK